MCLGQGDEERQLDALGRRLASWCMAEIAPAMHARPRQGIGERIREGLTAGVHLAVAHTESGATERLAMRVESG
jgi:hypothetical protein